MHFYHDDTVDVHYKVQVDNAISAVAHDNHGWHWMLHDNNTSVLGHFHYISVIDAL